MVLKLEIKYIFYSYINNGKLKNYNIIFINIRINKSLIYTKSSKYKILLIQTILLIFHFILQNCNRIYFFL